jgi:predicted nucleic acid-binding Zn ribbon protein
MIPDGRLAMSNKSILDNIKVDDSQMRETFAKHHGKQLLPIVSHCPTCGAPVYGKQLVASDETPEVKYSCDCRNGRKDVIGMIRTT